MQNLHESIKKKIEKLISKNLKENEQSLYWILQDNQISLGDESGLSTTIWTSTINWLDDNEHDKENDLDDNLIDKIQSIKFPETFKGDTITLNISDHHLYLITYYSGQY